jgi:diguanylate cyclase (GGDEF)-like protein
MARDYPRSQEPDGEITVRSGGWLRPGPHLWAALVVLALGVTFSLHTADLERQRDLSERRAQVQEELSNFRGKLETEVYASTALARVLAVQVVLQDGIRDAQFEATAEDLLRGQPHILSLSLAPGFVISNIVPRAGNEAAIGLSLMDDPIQKEALMRAISEDGPVLAGPFELVQGGQALAVRIPVWVDVEGVPRYWGAVSLVLDYEHTLERAGFPALERRFSLDIVGRDAGGPGGETILGPRLPASANPVKVPVILPGGSWLISAVPAEGWPRQAWWKMPWTLARLLLSVLAALATARILHDRRRIRRLAGVDMLTSLPNRRWALQQLRRMIARGRRGGDSFALLSLDLDGFKPVNDTHGHAAGDQVLAQIGRRLAETLRPGDTVARVGGDEFLALVPTDGRSDDDWLRSVALRLQAAVSRPVSVGAEWVVVGTCVGIARFPEDGDDSEVLLRKADEAMYRAKGNGGHGIEFARTSLPEHATAGPD